MNITILGATGMAGSAILHEATRRGHHAIAASRHPQPSSEQSITPLVIDLHHPGTELASAMAKSDALVLAVRMRPGEESHLAPITSHVLDLARIAQIHTLIVGGASPLRSPQSSQTLVLDDPTFVPPQWRSIAAASLEQFDACMSHPNQNWTYLSPSAIFEPGVGTGTYRRGDNTLLLNHDGTSRITPDDLALAVLDELEHPGQQQHFTVIEHSAP